MPLLTLFVGLALAFPSSALGYQPHVTRSFERDNSIPVDGVETGGGQALVLLAEDNYQQLEQVKSWIKANGGRNLHVFPDQAVIAQIPINLERPLAALPGVAAVFTQPVDPALLEVYSPYARRLASVWNNLIAPSITLQESGRQAEVQSGQPDAFTAPDLTVNEVSLAANSSITPGYYQTSEYLVGSVAVGIILVESNGQLDPSSENWTPDEQQQVFSEIVAGLNWWAKLEPRADLSFVYDDHFSQPLPTRVEPISRPYGDQQYWISDAMNALGYKAPTYFTSVRNYNNTLRLTYHTDWAFTIFVVDSSTDTDNHFSDGYFAYAYLGGPFMVMTSENNGYGPEHMDAVTAHETGHIFYALDQYPSAGERCTSRSGYLNVENENSQNGTCSSNVDSIMRGQIYPYAIGAIDRYAAGQVGWRDSDMDGILDPLDTLLTVNINQISTDSGQVFVQGTAEITPYPSPTRADVTINTVAGVSYRVDGGGWQQAVAVDGRFENPVEEYGLALTLPSAGPHTLEIAATDSAGNVSTHNFEATITMDGPVDDGLNTQLYSPANPLTVGTAVMLEGVAYHLYGQSIMGVTYQVNSGPAQVAVAKDGAFDSSYEPFTLPLSLLETGTYRVEAFATDAQGRSEIYVASQEIQVGIDSSSYIFLPAIKRR